MCLTYNTILISCLWILLQTISSAQFDLAQWTAWTFSLFILCSWLDFCQDQHLLAFCICAACMDPPPPPNHPVCWRLVKIRRYSGHGESHEFQKKTKTVAQRIKLSASKMLCWMIANGKSIFQLFNLWCSNSHGLFLPSGLILSPAMQSI